MRSASRRSQNNTYLILLWLPLAGAVISAAAVYFTAGAYGFDLLWIRWSPGVVGFLAFVALFASVALYYLSRGLFRLLNRVPTEGDDAGGRRDSSKCSKSVRQGQSEEKED